MIGALIRLARPRHWVKNVFVLMPVPFAVVAGATVEPVVFLLGLAGFSLLNSTVYVFNDILDAESDRHHPRKRFRPVASGEVPVRVAVTWGLVLGLAGLALVAATGILGAVAVSVAYLVLNGAYSLGAKNRALLDVFLISSGFVIRVTLGALLVGATPSNWLLLCTSALALFLGFAKRRADLYEGLDEEHRRSLADYTMPFLDHMLTGSAGVALMSYALYSMDSELFLPGRELAGMPFVAYGILFYLWQAHLKGAGASPVDIALRSRTVWACLLGWGIAVAWSLGLV